MFRLLAKIAGPFVALCMLTGTALAQLPNPNVPELEDDDLVDEGLVEAEILAADYDARTLTLRFEPSNETRKVVVPENAELFQTRANDLEHRIELNELNPGDKISVEAFEVDGVIQLRIIGLVS